MKLGALLGLIALLAAVPAAYAREPCSLASLNGRYVITSRSEFTDRMPTAAVGLVDFDGRGHVHEVSTVSSGGVPVLNYTLNGSYTVSAGCAFTQTATNVVGAAAHTAGVISEEGDHVIFISTDPDDFATGDAWRLDRTTCHALPATRYAASGLMLYSRNGPETHVSVVNADEAGRLTITDSTTDLGARVSTGGTGTAQLLVHPDCTLAMSTSDGSSHYLGVARVEDHSIELYLIGTDPGTTVVFSAIGTPSRLP